MRGEVLKGHLDLLLLSTLEVAPAHGYVIIERLRERSVGVLDLAEGTIYPALHRLEHEGFVAGRWATVSGRRRRVYALTAVGRRTLQERRREWRQFAKVMGAIVTS